MWLCEMKGRNERSEVRWTDDDAKTMKGEYQREVVIKERADLQRRADRCDVWCPVSMEG